MTPKFTSVSRAQIVRKFVDSGLGYSEAHKAYNVMLQTFEDAILTNSRLPIGNVGALVPVRRPARVIKMGFERKGKVVSPRQREFSYGETVRWKFRVYRAFAKRHGVDGRIV